VTSIPFVVVCRFSRFTVLKSHLVWCTDLVADINNTVQLDKIVLNREDMFIKKTT
jgi:hypothetical protein